jgi:HlyD family secretion protein
VLLRVPQESERVVPAGTPLAEVGDPDRLEFVTDLLTADAVRVEPGDRVLIEDWGGDRPLPGRVRLVEPFGFTKISALGVEEQRVNVVIDFTAPRDAWRRLGHGYRATVRIIVDRVDRALKIPISALFRSSGRWAVFTVDVDGSARLRTVGIGRMNDDEAEVVDGLQGREKVILHPSDKVEDGVKVKARD